MGVVPCRRLTLGKVKHQIKLGHVTKYISDPVKADRLKVSIIFLAQTIYPLSHYHCSYNGAIKKASMSLQQHIDELLSTVPSSKGEHQQEWLALLNQWEEDQKT